jgi:multiple sugar transport system substrate-binding protein
MGGYRNTLKKAVSLLTVAVLCFTILSGCSGSGSTSGPKPTDAAGSNVNDTAKDNTPKEKTEIVFWHSWGDGLGLDALAKIVDTYNATNDKNIFVNLSYVASQKSGNTSTMEKLMAAVASGNPPEVALLDNFLIASWAQQGGLEPLDGKLETAGIDMSTFYEWAREGSYYKDAVYSIPYNGDSRALLYNKKMFEAAGLDPENPPSTIAELTEAAKALTVKNGTTFDQVGFIPWQNAGKPIYTWGWSFGADFHDKENGVLTIATEPTIEALQWEYDFASSFGLEDFVNFASGLGTNAEDPFVTEKLAMCIRGSFDVATIHKYNPDLDFGVAPIPSKVEGQNITWCGGWGLTIPKNAAKQEAAMDFIAYATGAEGQKIMSEVSGSFSSVPAVNAEVFANDEDFTVFTQMLDKAKVRPNVAVSQELWDGLNNVLDLTLHDKGTPEELLKELDTSMNEKLKGMK